MSISSKYICVCLFICGIFLKSTNCSNAFAQILHERNETLLKNNDNTKSVSIKEYESIAKELIVLPKEKRDYDLILSKFEALCKKCPHSLGANLAISLSQRWSEDGIISSKQNAKLRELANQKREDIEEVKKILANFDKAIQNNDTVLLTDIAKKLEDFIKKDGIGNEAKYVSIAQLITIYQRKNNFLRAKDLADEYIKNFSPDNMDFSGAVGFLFIAQQAEINYILLTSGIEIAVKSWEQTARKYSDYPSFAMDAFSEGIKLALAHNQGKVGQDLCEKFVATFPGSKDTRIFDVRLSSIIQEVFPQEKKLDATHDKKEVARQIAEARKKTLALLEDFKGTPAQQGAASFLVLLKEVEDISEGRKIPNKLDGVVSSFDIPPVSKCNLCVTIVVIIVNVMVIAIAVYRFFFQKQKTNEKINV
jgi:hypothetical protein